MTNGVVMEKVYGRGFAKQIKPLIDKDFWNNRYSGKAINEWKDVEKEVPPMGEYVLCACRANIYDVLKLTPEGWFHDINHIYMWGFVRAWQPLPDLYEGGKPI